MALFRILRGHDFRDLLPIIVIEVLHKLRVLDQESKKSILKQMSLIILPLCQGPQTLRRVLLLLEQLVEYLHSLVIRNDPLAIELILPILEPDDVFQIVASV